MAEWKQMFCILCYVNCGLEVATAGGKITRQCTEVRWTRPRGERT
jgi:hypothetical protein